MSYKAFPPLQGHVLLAMSSTEAARAGLELYTPSRPRSRSFRWVADLLLRLGGPSWLPARTREGDPSDVLPQARVVKEVLLDAYGPLELAGVYLRRHRRSGGAIVLTRGGVPALFVKFGPRANMSREREVLEMLGNHGTRAFAAPRAVGLHDLDDLSLLALEPIRLGKHTPVRRPGLSSILSEIPSALQGLRRPGNVPAQWSPAQGDFTPWNLRRTDDKSFLVDWEAAAYRPPGYDELYYATASATLRMGVRPLSRDTREAASHLRVRFETGTTRFDHAMLNALGRVV